MKKASTTSPPASDAATTTKHRGNRKKRPRPTPRWLKTRQDLDEMARRRCLLVLSALSGERPVTDVIAEAEISRGTYYQWEEKALGAMLQALSPTAAPDGASTDLASALSRVAELERKVVKLEQERRRSERLLHLTRKILPRGPVATDKGRPRKAARSSTSTGSASSSGSATAKATPAASGEPSIPTKDGATAR